MIKHSIFYFPHLCNTWRESWWQWYSDTVERVKLHKGSSFYQHVMRILMVTICVGGFTILKNVLMGLYSINSIAYKELSQKNILYHPTCLTSFVSPKFCWWFRNPANQLRLVVYPIIYRAFVPPRWLALGISEPSTVPPSPLAALKMGVSKNRGTPKWMVKIMENPMSKWMIWGENPLFSETSQ